MCAIYVCAYHRHPLRRIASLVGRCLTVLWKMTVAVLTPREMVTMPEMLHFVLKVRERALREGGKWKWAEFDLVEMFPNIQREDILKSLEWIAKELMRKQSFRGGISFFIAKSGIQRLDNPRQGARDSYYYFTMHDLTIYVKWYMAFNTCFLSLSSVMTHDPSYENPHRQLV